MPRWECGSLRTKSQLRALVSKYELGKDAARDAADNAKILSQKIKALIIRHGDVQGNVTNTWTKMTTEERNCMVKDLHAIAPWLEAFEKHWGSDWLLSRAVSRRVSEAKRKSKNGGAHSGGQDLLVESPEKEAEEPVNTKAFGKS